MQAALKSAPEQRWVQLAFRCTSAAAWNTKLWSGRRADRRHVWTKNGNKRLIQVWFKNQQNKGANQCLDDVAQTQQRQSPMVTFIWHARKYREHIRYYRMYLWWSLCTMHLPACQVSYCRQLRLLFLCLRDIFRVLINSLVCWFCACAVGLFLIQIVTIPVQTVTILGQIVTILVQIVTILVQIVTILGQIVTILVQIVTILGQIVTVLVQIVILQMQTQQPPSSMHQATPLFSPGLCVNDPPDMMMMISFIIQGYISLSHSLRFCHMWF